MVVGAVVVGAVEVGDVVVGVAVVEDVGVNVEDEGEDDGAMDRSLAANCKGLASCFSKNRSASKPGYR